MLVVSPVSRRKSLHAIRYLKVNVPKMTLAGKNSVKIPTRICRLLAFLGMHDKGCKRCQARETHGRDMLKRLEELSARTFQHSPAGENADKEL